MKFLNTINFIKKNQFSIGVFGIIISFIIVRLPYFIYMPIPFINGDAFEYNRVINLLESGANVQIGFPGIGYPLLILLCEKISNTTIFFFFIQSLLQLLAVLLFYTYYKIYIEKYLFFVAMILVGYLTSNINLYYDTAYHPDSLMGSLFIFSIALFLRVIYNPSYFYFAILSFVIIFSVSVRANGIVLIPLVFLYLIYILIATKSFIITLKYGTLFLLPTLILCLFHYFSPIYKTFNIISYQSESMASGSIYIGSKTIYPNHSVWKKIENLNLNKFFYTNKIDKNALFDDTTFAIFVMAQQRGYMIHQNNQNEIIIDNFNDSRSNWATINLDRELHPKDKLKYIELKKHFKVNFNNQKLVLVPPIDFKHKLMHFIGFYQLFYKSIDLNGTILGFENLSFYDINTKMRYGNCYNELQSSSYKNDLKRVYKELYTLKSFSENNLLYKIDQDSWRMKTSKFYRWILAPFYKIQPILFRNFLFPLVFNGVFILSLIGVFYSKFKSKILIFSLISSLVLFITNFLFSFIFCYSYTRYTYQVSFVYYVSLVILPILISEFRNLRLKNKSLNL